MTAIDAAAPRPPQAGPAGPRFNLPPPREVNDRDILARQLAEHGNGMTVEQYDAWMADVDRAFAEMDKRRASSGDAPVRFAGAADAAAEGQRLVSSLGGLAGTVNEMRQALASLAGDDRGRALFGEEWAAARLRRMEEGIQAFERGIKGYEAEIGDKFQVQGALTQRGEDGGWRLGAFVLEHQGEGFAARVGSGGQAWVSQGGGAFRPAEPGAGAAAPTPTPTAGVDLRA